MKQIEVNVGETKVIATYNPIFRQMVEIELINPFKGFKLEFAKDGDECNLFDEVQAEVFIKESLALLIKQIDNVIRYRSIYQNLNKEYKKITDIMLAVLNDMDITSRKKFRYHCELQTKVQEEIFKQIRTMIPEINEYNQKEYLIYHNQLIKILSVI